MSCSKKRKPEIRELSGTEKKKDRVKIVIEKSITYMQTSEHLGVGIYSIEKLVYF